MNRTLHASINSQELGLVPKDLKQFKKLFHLSKVQCSGTQKHNLSVTVGLISAGLTMLNLSKSQLEQSHEFNQTLIYEGQNLLNKRALISLLKPNHSHENSNAFSLLLHPSMGMKNKLDSDSQKRQICGSPLSITSFSGNLTLALGSKSCHKASKMRLCYQIAQQIYRIHANAHIEHISKSPYNLLGALVISKNHKWFIDSTELKQSLILQENLVDPSIALKQLICTSKRSTCQKAQAKLTLRLLYIKYTNYA